MRIISAGALIILCLGTQTANANLIQQFFLCESIDSNGCITPSVTPVGTIDFFETPSPGSSNIVFNNGIPDLSNMSIQWNDFLFGELPEENRLSPFGLLDWELNIGLEFELFFIEYRDGITAEGECGDELPVDGELCSYQFANIRANILFPETVFQWQTGTDNLDCLTVSKADGCRRTLSDTTEYFLISQTLYNVPEPTTLALMSLGLVGWGFGKRKILQHLVEPLK